MVGHLAIIDAELGRRVEAKLGMEGEAETIRPARDPIDLEPSPSLSLVRKATPTLAGRKVGILVSDGSDRALVERVRAAVEKEHGTVEVVAPRIGGATGADGKPIAADHALAAAPSVLFDAVLVAAAAPGIERLLALTSATDWVRDAFAHLKVIGHVTDAAPLLERAGIAVDDGVLVLRDAKDVGSFVSAVKNGRVWEREREVEQRAEGSTNGRGGNGDRAKRAPLGKSRREGAEKRAT